MEQVKRIDETKRQEIVDNLERSLEIIDLQAQIAEAKARKAKAEMDEIGYLLYKKKLENGEGKTQGDQG